MAVGGWWSVGVMGQTEIGWRVIIIKVWLSSQLSMEACRECGILLSTELYRRGRGATVPSGSLCPFYSPFNLIAPHWIVFNGCLQSGSECIPGIYPLYWIRDLRRNLGTANWITGISTFGIGIINSSILLLFIGEEVGANRNKADKRRIGIELC